MRLIDADALLKNVKEEEDERHLDKGDASLLQFFIDCYAETVDAVPIIRCRDCEHYSNYHGYCYMLSNKRPHGDDYCSWGKRRENETD